MTPETRKIQSIINEVLNGLKPDPGDGAIEVETVIAEILSEYLDEYHVYRDQLAEIGLRASIKAQIKKRLVEMPDGPGPAQLHLPGLPPLTYITIPKTGGLMGENNQGYAYIRFEDALWAHLLAYKEVLITNLNNVHDALSDVVWKMGYLQPVMEGTTLTVRDAAALTLLKSALSPIDTEDKHDHSA